MRVTVRLEGNAPYSFRKKEKAVSRSLALRFRLIMLSILFLAALISAIRSGQERSAKAFAQSDLDRATIPTGYVLQPNEGETLQRPGGQIVIKADPRTGSGRLAVGSQQLYVGAGIRVHRHEGEDEVLWVQDGSGTAIIGDTRKPVEKGAFVYIPQGVWHGVENPQNEMRLLWIVSPPGLENFFREVGTPPGVEPRKLTPEQLNDVARKHGTSFKTQ
jgi:mannose-6-phosphate isomerase-like protein (cupin superfamily)